MPTSCDRCGAGSVPHHLFEPLEPRLFLSASYTGQTAFDAFEMSRLIHAIPAQGVEMAQFGYSVAALGDINGDGADDFAISAPGMRHGEGAIGAGGQYGASDWGWSGTPGAVYIFSGIDRTLMRTLSDGFAGFGSALLDAGDLDGDGVGDLAVGSPSFDATADATADRFGRIWIYSGANGTVIRTLTGSGATDELGWSLNRGGDLDGDGVQDLLAGAPGANGTGRAYVYSGADGAVLRTFNGTAMGDRFGHAVGGGVDTPVHTDWDEPSDGDGVPDYIVGAPGNEEFGVEAGAAYVFDGASGSLRYMFTGEAAGDQFGAAVAIVGYAGQFPGFLLRYLVGAPGFDFPSFGDELPALPDAGHVYRFTAGGGGPDTGSYLVGVEAGAAMGARITLLDGYQVYSPQDPDPAYALFSPGAQTTPRMRLFPGNTTNSLSPVSSFLEGATSIAYLGDADRDGISDFIGGSPLAEGSAAQLVPTVLAGPLPGVAAISDNGQYAIIGDYVSRNGVLQSIASLPGLLDGDLLLAVNDAGLFVGRARQDLSPFPGFFAPPGAIFFYYGSARVTLEQAIVRTFGTSPTALDFVDLSNAGDVVFDGLTGSGQAQSAYLFRGGSLVELWAGGVSAVSDSGMVVGASGSAVYRFTPAGQVQLVKGLQHSYSFYRPGMEGVNSRGDIVGGTEAIDLASAAATNAALTTLAARPTVPPSTGSYSWSVEGVDESGRIFALLNYIQYSFPSGRPPSTVTSVAYLYTPGVGLQQFLDTVLNPTEAQLAYPTVSGPAQFLSDGRIMFAGMIYTPTEPPPVNPVAAADSRLTSAYSGAGVEYAGMINEDGLPVVLRTTASGTVAQTLSLRYAADPAATASDIVLYTDPRDSRVYAVVRAGNDLLWYTPYLDGSFDTGVNLRPTYSDWDLPVTPMVHVSTTDGRAILSGLTADGDVVIIEQTTSTAPPDSAVYWAYHNLSTERLAPTGQSTPAFTGPLTAFVSAWNAINLVGLDSDGRVQTVWSIPGAVEWTVSNLSAASNAPRVYGVLAAYTTPWSALNVVASDSAGRPVTLWWVPQFGGNWAYDPLSNSPEAPVLDGSALAAFVTPWAALNVVGRDADSGEIIVYWWTPSTQVWSGETISVSGSGGIPVTTGAIAAGMLGPSRQSVFAIQAGTNHLLQLFWTIGDGADWTVQDLTMLV
ncbi:MAG: FG-GAP repeat protein [Phycisphaeraceae bacterium]|nr:FG-GAP repeat protein [Phycisphaeraceae bacterium]